MDTALPQKLTFILDKNLAKANCTGNRVCTSCPSFRNTIAYPQHFNVIKNNKGLFYSIFAQGILASKFI